VHTTTRKRKEKEEPLCSGEKEGKVVAGIAVCAVGAMMSLLLLVIVYTHIRNDG